MRRHTGDLEGLPRDGWHELAIDVVYILLQKRRIVELRVLAESLAGREAVLGRPVPYFGGHGGSVAGQGHGQGRNETKS